MRTARSPRAGRAVEPSPGWGTGPGRKTVLDAVMTDVGVSSDVVVVEKVGTGDGTGVDEKVVEGQVGREHSGGIRGAVTVLKVLSA